MNNSFNSRLLQFVLALFAVFYWQGAYADGSRDLYPSGATGGRAYMISSGVNFSGTNANSYPFTTLGTHYVYVKVGEKIYVGSSAQNTNNGRIRLIAPNGDVYTSTNNNTGRIENRTQELNGPRVGTSSTDYYLPFSHSGTVTAGQEGVWRVEFIPPVGESGTSPAMPSVGADDNWSQPTGSSTAIAAWDVSVRNVADNGWVSGRVYTNVLNLSLSQTLTTARSYYGTTYALTKDGYVFRVKGNGLQGMYYTFFVNNKGFYAPDLPGNSWTADQWKNATPTDLPSYKSFDFSNYADMIAAGPWIQDPRIQDSPTGITHKMFYTIPNNYAAWDLPPTASVYLHNETSVVGQTWLKATATVIPEVSDVTVTGVEGENGQASNKGANINFTANLAGTVRIKITSTNPVFTEREIIGVAHQGPGNVVYWDGLDGDGNPMPAGELPTTVTLKLQGGEVHFPYMDMEINPNGLIIERLNPGNFAAIPMSDNVYWDDSKITIRNDAGNIVSKSSEAVHPSSVTIDINGAGISSNSDGHKWGLHGKSTSNTTNDGVAFTGRSNFNHGYGNERGIDTYAFLLGDEYTLSSSIFNKSIDLAVTSISHNYTGTDDPKPNDEFIYTARVTNLEGDDAIATYEGGNLVESTGSFFELYLPEGINFNNINNIVVSVVNDPGSPNGAPREVTDYARQLVEYEPGKWKVKMMVDLPVGAILDIAIPVVVTSTATPGADIIVWATMLRPHDVNEKDATNLTVDLGGDVILPTDPFFECQGPTPTSGIPFDPSTHNIGDPIPCNNLKVSADLKVFFAPDLEFVKTAALTNDVNGDNVIDAGDEITYTFTVTNTGNVTLTNVALTEKSFSGTGLPKPNPGWVSSTLGSSAGTLLPNEVATYTATYIVTAADVIAGEISNQATVNADDSNGDPVGPVDSGNDPSDPGKPGEPGDPTVVQLAILSDLSILKSVSNSQPKVGDVVTFSLTVENLGPQDTDDVVIKDVVPDGYTVQTINNSGVQVGNEITWTLTSLANGADATVSFTAMVLTTGTHDNTATVSGENDDPDPGNNTSTTIVTPRANTRPDVNAGQVNTNIPGNVNTNDDVPVGTTYNNTPPAITGQPTGSNPSLTVNADGTYIFTTDLPGVYEYDVPVCVPNIIPCDVTERLIITVTDPALGNNPPVALDDLSETAFNTAITYPVLTNDGPGNVGGSLNNPTIVGGTEVGGTFSVEPDGRITYTPTTGFTGEASVTYQVCETPGGLCATAVWRITVKPAGAANTTFASDDYVYTVGTTPVTGNVKDNDIDPEGDDQTVQTGTGSVTIAGQGTLVWSTTNNGEFTFTADPGFTGTVDIPYTTCDDGSPQACANATLHIVVEAPVIITRPDVNAGQVNTNIPGNVSTNDEVPPGTTYGPPTGIPGNPNTNVPVMNPDGSYTFTTNIPGVYEFDVPYCAPGVSTPCPTEKLIITVTDPAMGNNPPVANDDQSVTAFNTAITYPVLTNDGPGNIGGSLNNPTIVGGTEVGGTFTVESDGQITYTPTPGFTGEASVTYQVCEAPSNECATAVWRITVQPAGAVNTTSASDDYVHTIGTTPVSGNVKDNDRDPEGDNQTVQNSGTVNLPGQGTLVWGPANGEFTFTAVPGFAGTVDIPYTTCDDGTPQACANATIHIVVQAPVISTIPDENTGEVNVPIPGDVSTNDNVPPGTTYGPPAGVPGNPNTNVPVMNPDGSYTFTTNIPGVYEFDVPYCAPSVSTPCPTEKLIITVTDPLLGNNPPVATDDYAETLVGQPITDYPVLANDIPGNVGGSLIGSATNPSITTNGTKGVAMVNADGTITYTPNPGEVGTDQIVYRVCESPSGECTTATWHITIRPSGALNTTSASDDLYHTVGTTPVTGNVKDNDVDAEGHTQTVSNSGTVNIPGQGTLEWSSTENGEFIFTAVPGFVGTVNIPYTTCDNGAPVACADATLRIVVQAEPFNTRPDVNAGLVNETIPGNVSTNDEVSAGTTYGTPSVSTGNPNNNIPVMDPSGSYTFVTDVPGVYEFDVPVCVPGSVIPCPTEKLVITVTDATVTNNPPVLVNDISVTLVNTAVTKNVRENDRPGNDGGTLGAPAITTGPAHGTVVVNPDGTLTYTPNTGYIGTDQVVYRVCELPGGQCATAIWDIEVRPLGALNTTYAADDYAHTIGVVPVSGNVKDNDTDLEGDTQTVTNSGTINLPQGTLVWGPANGTYTFTAVSGFIGTVDVPYTTCDNGSPQACANATLHIVVEAPKPDLTFVKTAVLSVDNGTAGKADVNDVITYTFTVTNTGNVVLENVTVTDPLAGLSAVTPAAVATLAPAATATFTATYTVTQADVDAGKVENMATVTTDNPDGGPLDPTESTEDPDEPGEPGVPGKPTIVDAVDPQPNLSFVKTASKTTDALLGETITYTFTVTNTGNVTLSGVTITDPLPDLINWNYTWPGLAGVLAPGQNVIATADYVVKATDLTAGQIENQATVEVTTPPASPNLPPVESGNTPPAPGTPTTPGDPTVVTTEKRADLSIVKDDGSTTYIPGTTVTYTVTVTNNGPSHVVGATITDVLPATTTGTWTAVFTNASGTASGTGNINETVDIQNGGSIVYTVNVVVPSGYAIANGNLINTASVGVPPGTTDPDGGNNGSTDTDTPAPVADLSIVKTDNSATYTPGMPVVYTITVTNNGPSDVATATVTDNLPTGTSGTWTAVLNSGATGNTSSVGTVTSINETVGIPNGGSIVYTVNVNVPSNYAITNGHLVNTATVSLPPAGPGVPTDPTPGNDTSTDDNPPAPVADLAVVKTSPGTTYIPGTTVTYTVTVTNNGPSDVVGARVEDQLPAGTTGNWTAVFTGGATGTASGASHIDQNVNIPNGGSIVYTVNVHVPSDYTGNLVNAARVTPPVGTEDTTPGNNTSTDDNDPAPVADLSIVKTNGSTTYTPGTTVIYTVTVINNGPSNVVGATITDNLPLGTTGNWTAVMNGGATGALSGTGNINQTVNIPNGSSIVYTVNVQVPSDFTGTLTNTASASVPPGTTDPDGGNNSDEDTDDPAPVADLSIVKADNSATYTPGTTVTYTVTVRNNGPSDVPSATVIDNLPAGTTGAWTAVATNASVPATNGPGNINQTVSIQNGGSIVYTVIVNVPSDYAITNGHLVNTATVSLPPAGPGVPTDPTPGNDTSTDDNPPAPVADLAVVKTNGSTTYIPGTTVTYTVTVTNNGPSDVTNAIVTDILPAGTTGDWTAVFTDATGTASGTGHINETVNIQNGGEIVYTVNVHVPSNFTGNLVNTARAAVPPGTEDPTPGNDISTDIDTPDPVADLVVTKDNGSATYTPGTTVAYTVTVINNGPADVTGAMVTDNLPAGTTGTWTATFVGGASGTVSGSGNISQPVNIPNGGSIVYTVLVNVPSGFTGNLRNTARADVPTGVTDPDGGDNEDFDEDTPAPVADLSIVKTDNSATYTPGTTVTYTITVTNNGPSDVATATVTDNLPIGTSGTWTAVLNGGATGNTSSVGTVTSINETVGIPNGGSVVYTVNVVVPSNYTGSLVNTATVTPPPGTDDPTPDNDTSTDENTPAPVADLSLTKTVDNATPKIDEVVTFTLTVTNNGPSNAAGIVVTDQLPNGYTFVSDNPSVGTYDAGTGVWTVGTLANGANATLEIEARVRSTGDYRNTATVTSPANDPNPGDNTDEAKPSVIDAFDDHLGSFIGHDGGTTLGSVLDNDLLNGASATLSVVTLTPGTAPAPVNGAITMNANGTITVAPGTTAGAYTYPYTICEIGASPANCDNAVATIIVTAAPIQALDNTYGPVRGDTGDPNVGNVLNNDNFNGGTATTTDVTLTVVTPATPVTPGAPVPSIGTDGQVSVPPNTPDGTYTIEYRICEILNPTNCSTAEIRVTVGDSNIDALDDNYSSTPVNGKNGDTLPSVLGNDILNGVILDPLDITLTPGTSPLPGQITMNPDGSITVAPNTPAGTYTYTYRICENLNPTNCDDALAVIVVAAAVIDAVIDDYAADTNNDVNGKEGTESGPLPSVVATNDLLNGAALNIGNIGTDITLTPGTSPHPNISMSPFGEISVAANTPAGIYTYPYTICEILNPTNCDNTVAIIRVVAAPIVANDDFTPAAQINGLTGGKTPTVLGNDRLNGVTVVPSEVTLIPGTPSHPGLTMNPDGTISVAPGTPIGTYTYTYTICEVLNPTNCDNATAEINVFAATVVANDDDFGPINGATGSTNVGNALTNDRLNGLSVTLEKVTIGNIVPATSIGGAPVPVLDPNTGIVSVPAGTPAGTYTIGYEICEILNASNCDDATITITVTAAPILARPDHYGPVTTAAGHPNLGNVLANDELNGQQASLDKVILTVTATATGAKPGNPNTVVPILHPSGVVSVPVGTPADTYTISYDICEVLNPTNCSSTTVTVIVSETPINAVNDRFGPVVGLQAKTLGNALDNDTFNNKGGLKAFNDGLIDFGTITPAAQQPGAPVAYAANVPVLNTTTGEVSIPAMTPAGTYVIGYEICEVADPTNCDQATITVEVTAAVIDPDDDFFGNIDGITGSANVGNVLTNDKLNFVQVNPADVTITVLEAATSVPGAVNGNVPVLNPATGIVSVQSNTPAGEYKIRYQICENLNPTNCDWATAYVNVVLPVIDAVDDTYGPVNSVTGNNNVGNVLDNDRFNSGQATTGNVAITQLQGAVPVQGAPSGSPLPVLNTTTGVVSVPAGTPEGQYQIHYRICDRINPTRCDDAFVTIRVFKPEINAVDDNYTSPVGMVGSSNLGNILTNDTFNGGPATTGTTGNVDITVLVPAVPNHNAVNTNVPVVNPATGVVSVPVGTPAGTYQIRYRICDKLNPTTNCDNAVVTVVVPAAVIDAVDDFTPEARINGYDGGTTTTVLTNDRLNGQPINPANITLTPDMDGPYPGKLTFNPDGTITVAPQTEAGTYRWWYTICENLNPGNCDRAVATITVLAAPIDAVNDRFDVMIERFGSKTPSVLENDLLNGVKVIPSEITLTPGIPSHPGLHMNADGTIDIEPGMKVGTYTYPYTICEVLNPANCDDAVATIVITADDLFIPNTVTPNGDGKNDVFEIVGWEAYDRVELVVFNRWGNEVFRNVDYDNRWTATGLNEGTYYYMVKLIKGNTTDTRKGWVLIKKN